MRDPLTALFDPAALAAVDVLEPAQLPAMLAALAALQARAAARLAREATSAGRATPGQNEDGDGRLLTIPQVAEQLGVPKQHAYDLARRELPAVRFGKYVRVRAADLDAWITRHRD